MNTPHSFSKLAAVALALTVTSVQAATYIQTAYNPSGGSTWNAQAVWGNNAVTSGNIYQTAPEPGRVTSGTPLGTSFTVNVGDTSTAFTFYSYIRDFGTGTPTAGSVYAFNGDKVILTEKTAFRSYGRNTTTLANWEMQNGSLMVLNANGTGTSTMWDGTIVTSGTTAIGLVTSNLTALTIGASIAGTGTLNLVMSGGSESYMFLNGDISGFVGTLFLSGSTAANANLRSFSIANSAPSATLQLNYQSTAFHYDLASSNVSFSSLVLTDVTGANTVLGSGVYDAAFLNTLTGDTGIFSGTGTITIAPVPEPSTYALVLAGILAAAIAVRHRRHSARLTA